MFTRKMKIVLLLFVLFCLADNANATPRWRILDSGAIEWQIDGRLPYVADDTQQYTCKPDATICN